MQRQDYKQEIASGQIRIGEFIVRLLKSLITARERKDRLPVYHEERGDGYIKITVPLIREQPKNSS